MILARLLVMYTVVMYVLANVVIGCWVFFCSFCTT